MTELYEAGDIEGRPTATFIGTREEIAKIIRVLGLYQDLEIIEKDGGLFLRPAKGAALSADPATPPLSAQLAALDPAQIAAYGYCPVCGAMGSARERRINGNDQCIRGHVYPSANAKKEASNG